MMTVSRLFIVFVLLAAPGLALAQDPATAAAPAQATAPAAPAPQANGNGGTASPPEGFFREPALLTGVMEFINRKIDQNDEPKSGFYPEVSNMITGAGWLSVGPGYRQFLYDRELLLDTSAALSWRLYKMVQARAELPELWDDRLTLGVQSMWKDSTQVNYFGIGPGTSETARSQYRLKDIDYIGYASLRMNDWLTLDGVGGWLASPTVEAPGGTFRPDVPSTLVAFPNDPAVSLAQQPDYLHWLASITADTRDFSGHPTQGGRYRAAVTGYSDESTGVFTFRQYELEATQFIPLLDRRWVLAFRGWGVFSDVAPGHEVPFYFLPTIGGHNTLRGFHSFQFHDRDSLVANAESRWSIFTHVDAAVFFDAGNVAPDWRDLNLDETSYGAGVRLHTGRTTIGRLDVAHSRFGWEFFFRTSDPMRLSRGKRRVAAIPATP